MERQEIEQRALAVVGKAQALTIISSEDLTLAGEFLTGVKAIRKQIGEVFDPIIKKAFQAHKEAVKQKKQAEAPLVEAERIVKPRIAFYIAEQERLKQEEEARLQREAEKKAEEERLARALEAEKNGDKEEAEEILVEPEYVPPVILPKATPKLEGISIRKNWTFQIIDESKIPREFLTVNTVKLGQFARAMKEQANVPGIRFFMTESVAART